MKRVLLIVLLTILPCSALAQRPEQKPEISVEQWKGKTAVLTGAHADDDQLSHGTLALLQAHGNQVYVVTLTTGNVGTQDPNLSRTQLAQIRRQEELAALAELGIPADHYINLGYDDGLLEFEDRKAVVENLVRLIRKMRPDVLFAPCGEVPMGSGQKLSTLAQIRSPRRCLPDRRCRAGRDVASAVRGSDHAGRPKGVYGPRISSLQ